MVFCYVAKGKLRFLEVLADPEVPMWMRFAPRGFCPSPELLAIYGEANRTIQACKLLLRVKETLRSVANDNGAFGRIR